ncbi:myb-related transcription factor, partner of profilin [Lampris incognitus]|uniref:myb-related transcription factor, partner of profilin n=1 Tax=Lampris incognitus TaxID=2546036 RepID=UPI0024B5DEA9|nr:myb-related transcription factor, partner of profilin [Lampris incognitus]
MSSPLYYHHESVGRFKKRKARFTFSEVHILLDEVRKNRFVVVGKFNRGVPTDIKKRTWAEITARVNEIGECQREVIEVIKKWSDLKCDTKRKVAAMRAGTVPNRSLSSRLSRDLTHTERIVHQILEMDDKGDRVSDEFGPLGDDDGQEEEDEMEEEDMMGLQGSPNGGMDMSSMAPPAPYSMGDPALPSAKEDHTIPNYSGSSRESLQPSLELQYEIPAPGDADAPFVDSDDDDQREELFPTSRTAKLPGDHHGALKQHGIGPPHPSSFSAIPPPSGHLTQSAKDGMLQSAVLSLQEQHATNMLLETVSRSLELLSESVQQLAETQQEFVRESLQLQRETVQVLRDFTGGAIALMHDKLNGRPAL